MATRKPKQPAGTQPDTLHPLQQYVLENFEYVTKLPRQLTEEQCAQLVAEFPKKLILDTLEEMENYAPLTKRYRSVYLTLRKWCKMNQGASAPAVPGTRPQAGGWSCTHAEALNWLQKQGIAYSELEKHFRIQPQAEGKPLWVKL